MGVPSSRTWGLWGRNDGYNWAEAPILPGEAGQTDGFKWDRKRRACPLSDGPYEYGQLRLTGLLSRCPCADRRYRLKRGWAAVLGPFQMGHLVSLTQGKLAFPGQWPSPWDLAPGSCRLRAGEGPPQPGARDPLLRKGDRFPGAEHLLCTLLGNDCFLFSFSYVPAVLGCNSHTIQLTHLKQKIQWVYCTQEAVQPSAQPVLLFFTLLVPPGTPQSSYFPSSLPTALVSFSTELPRWSHTVVSRGGLLSRGIMSSRFLHVRGGISSTLFHFMAKLHRADGPHFTYPLRTCWRFGWFHLLALVNNGAENIAVQVRAQTRFHSSCADTSEWDDRLTWEPHV